MERDKIYEVAIGDNIRALLKRRGWKPGDLSRALGGSPTEQAISQWKGSHGPSVANRRRVAEVLGVTIDQLESRRLTDESEPNQEGELVDKNASLTAITVVVSLMRPELSQEEARGLAAVLLNLALNPPDPASQASYEDQLRAMIQGALAARSG